MRTKAWKMLGFMFLIAVILMGIVSTAQPVAASGAIKDAGDAGITSDESGVKVAAARPWTAKEMLAAIPYPLPAAELGAESYSADASLGPDGPAGFASGARPNAGTGAGSLAEELADAGPLGVSPLGYTYPAPFTRFSVAAISPLYSAYPFRTVGKLFFKQYGVSYVCSASVVGNKGILTAGHCVHAGDNKATGWSTNVVFVPAYKSGAAPYGQWAVPSLRTFTAWYANEDLSRDWGAGRITQVIGGKTIGQTVGYLGYAYNYSRVQDWWSLGYPAASPFNGALMYACTASYAYDSPFGLTAPKPMGIGCDQTGGTSGGPWIMKFGSSNYANGVNSHRATAHPLEMFSPYADSSVKTVIFDYIRLP